LLRQEIAGPKTEVSVLKIWILMREKGRKFMRANGKQSVIVVAILLLLGMEIAGVSTSLGATGSAPAAFEV